MEIKFLKNKKVFKKKEIETDPNLYWKYVLLVTFILILVSCAFGFYLFSKTNKNLMFPTVNLDEQGAIKKERLDNVLEYFKERENKSIEISNSPSPISDPSL